VSTFVGGAVALAFDPAGRLLAVASPESAVYIWDVKGQLRVSEFAMPDKGVAAVAFSPDGRLLAAGCDEYSVLLWDVPGDQLLIDLGLDTPVCAVRFSADGQTLFTGNGNTTCYAIPVARLLNG
jgi:WD40 repeat protein